MIYEDERWTGPSSSKFLAPRHREMLQNAGIELAVSYAAGDRSIEKAQDLPDALRYQFAGPGILFWHHPVASGRNAERWAVPQYRPDNPTGPKYIFPPRETVGLSVLPTEQPKIARAQRILIVEGTKQQRAAASVSDEAGVGIIGLAGCTGYASKGLPVPELKQIFSRSDVGEVFVAFDGDIATNRNVWLAADRLRQLLTDYGEMGRTKGDDPLRISFLDLSDGGEKAGLDDVLAAHSPDPNERADKLYELLEKAGELPPCPSDPRLEGPYVDVEKSCIRDRMKIETVFRDDGTGYERELEGRLLLGAAIEIVESSRTASVIDPQHHPTWRHHVRVTINGHHIETKVSDEALESVKPLLELHPRGHEVGVPSSLDRVKVVQAVRSTARSRPVLTEFEHSGWICLDGETEGYVVSDCVLAPDGVRTSPRGRQNLPVAFPSLATASANDREQAREAFWSLWALMSAPGPFGLAVCALLEPVLGLGPWALPMLIARPGSGKTELLRLMSSLQAGHDTSITFSSTKGALTSAGSHEAHQTCVIVDDFRVLQHKGEAENAASALDHMARRAYDGPSAVRQRLRRNEQGSYGAERGGQAVSGFLVAGEAPPMGPDTRSLMERIYGVEVPSNLLSKVFKEWSGSSATLNLAWGDLILFLAENPRLRREAAAWRDAEIVKMSGLGGWCDAEGKLHQLSNRSIRMLATAAATLRVLPRWEDGRREEESKPSEEPDYTALIEEEIAALARARVAQERTVIKAADPADGVLETLRGAVASGRWTLQARHADPSTRTLGTRTSVRDPHTDGFVEVIAVISSAAKEVTGGRDALLRDEWIVRNARGERSYSRRIPLPSGGSAATKCLHIKAALWDQASDGTTERHLHPVPSTAPPASTAPSVLEAF